MLGKQMLVYCSCRYNPERSIILANSRDLQPFMFKPSYIQGSLMHLQSSYIRFSLKVRVTYMCVYKYIYVSFDHIHVMADKTLKFESIMFVIEKLKKLGITLGPSRHCWIQSEGWLVLHSKVQLMQLHCRSIANHKTSGTRKQ